jgi:ABC-type transporter Mla subunit MlaD
METVQEIKAFIYDKLLEREQVMRQANEEVDLISSAANSTVDTINNEIQSAQQLLDTLDNQDKEE